MPDLVKTFIENVKQKAAGEKVYDSITPGQQFVKIVLDELISFLSSEKCSYVFGSSIYMDGGARRSTP